MSNLDALLSQPKTHEWPTPQPFFDTLNFEFGFTLDAAANKDNAKCAKFYSGEWGRDGLTNPWVGVVWCNPPYGTEIGKWVRKGYESAQQGAVVVMLIPSRTDTAYWHDYVMKASEIRFVRGRLRFGDAVASAPFPSAVVVFRSGENAPVVVGMDK